jgi:hypothetical protein
MTKVQYKLSGALTAQDSELTLSAPSGDSAHSPNPSTWPRDAFLRFRNLRRCVVAVPWAECVRARRLAGEGRDGDGGNGGGSGGEGDMGECMTGVMRGRAGRRGVTRGQCEGGTVGGADGVAMAELSRESSEDLMGI